MSINILKIINNNNNLKNRNKKITKLLNFKELNNLNNLDKEKKFRLENIISTILLKEKISDDEQKLLNEIFDSLNKDKDIDILNSSILMKMIDKVYLIDREGYKDFFNNMFDKLFDSDLLRYYKIISTGKR